MYLRKNFSLKFTFCVFALLATQELQAAPYIYSHHARGSTTVTSQLLGTRIYNAEEEKVSEGDSAGKLTNYTYNSTGQLITIQDRDGNFIHNTYNGHEQIEKSWADQSASTTTPGANASDRLTPQYDSGNDQNIGSIYQQNPSTSVNTTTLNYNVAGELSSKQYSNGKTQRYTYNLNGSTQSFTNVLNQTTNYTYTPMHQLQTVTMNGGTTTYTYDAFGRKTNETRPNGVQTNWTYDDYNGVKTMTSTGASSSRASDFSFSSSRASGASRGISSPQHNPAPQTLTQLDYTYYPDGNVHTETLGKNTSYTYQYNNLNQLQNFACIGTQCPKDTHGNTIANNTYTYTLNNGIATLTTKDTQGQTNIATYNYYPNYPDRLKNITNSNNNLNQPGTYIYDNNGNVTTDAKGDSLSYDALNQMLSLRNSEGAVTHYGYNADGKMNQETLAGKTPINEYYGGNGKAVTAKVQGTQAATYAMGLDRIAQYYFSNTAQLATSTQYYLYDQRGSVTNVLGSSSNTGYVYSPFGFLSTTNGAVKKNGEGLQNNTFGYIGQSLDPTTRLMMMGGYRAYDPTVGNFLKQDSYSPFKGAGTFNGYDYGAGNPILFEDPTGHFPSWPDLGWMTLGFAASLIPGLGAGLLLGTLLPAAGALATVGVDAVSGAAGGVLSSSISAAGEHKKFATAILGLNVGMGALFGFGFSVARVVVNNIGDATAEAAGQGFATAAGSGDAVVNSNVVDDAAENSTSVVDETGVGELSAPTNRGILRTGDQVMENKRFPTIRRVWRRNVLRNRVRFSSILRRRCVLSADNNASDIFPSEISDTNMIGRDDPGWVRALSRGEKDSFNSFRHSLTSGQRIVPRQGSFVVYMRAE